MREDDTREWPARNTLRFELTIAGELSHSVIRKPHLKLTIPEKGDGQTVSASIVDGPTVSISIRPEGEDSGEYIGAQVALPAYLVPNLSAYLALLQASAARFQQLLRPALAHEAILTFVDALNESVARLELEAVRGRDIADEHARQTAHRVNRWLADVPDDKRRSPWTKARLEHATRVAALAVLRADKKLTQDSVADEIRKSYPKIAPASGDALRQVFRELGVNWMAIKAEAQSLAKLRFFHAKTEG